MALQHGDDRRSRKAAPSGLALRLRVVARQALDLVYPPQALDGGARPLSHGLSAEAWSKLRFIAEPVCDGCGTPFEYAVAERCAACLAKPRAFARARSAVIYDDASRDLILQFKHADRLDLAPLLTAWVGRAAAELIAEADAVVPVPLHPLRLIRRRYNQAAEIARPLARREGLAYLPDALVRRRATDSQGGKGAGGRRRNVAGAFEVPKRRRGQVAGRRILLIDDVLTTGATAEACAKALLQAGAAQVALATVARVQEREL
ncbi:ComF family protein [Phenylobacterium montanum]|uniref:ComF family protein n=1 Tax=Phenylobacterium montanum TaxID=2823693 RepID=A0A975ITZ5_9CAUL|nr:ComF family protein [Caulobacter sp. S6]QUD87407.1 ComF family protein [Caulobacter sp. S6]